MTWQRGRKLSTVSKNGTAVSYAYDEDGSRLSKTVGGATTEFYTVNGVLYGQKNPDGTELVFLKDESGSNYGFTYDGATYYYLFTLQGDVKGIVDSNGVQVVSYTYDPYGKPLTTTGTLASTIGAINPIRYRGYYFDAETGFYYVSSRYYDPEIGRWINADGYVSTGQGITGYNMYAYCGNNPVMYCDPTGEVAVFAILGLVAVTVAMLFIPASEDQALIAAKQQAVTQYNDSTVNVYKRGTGMPREDKVNVEFYDADIEKGHININIDKSLEITSPVEINAVLDVVIGSPYYTEDLFGNKAFMRAQWLAHNWSNAVASSGNTGFSLMQTLSGSSNPIESASSLDIRSTGNMLRRQKILYTAISWVF